MCNIGINEYIIGAIHDKDTWYYVGEINSTSRKLKKFEKFSSFLGDAKRYSNIKQDLRRDLEMLSKTAAYRILEIQRCPKCKKEFTEYPALSRNDNKTEICPECGVKEAVEAFSRNRLAKQTK